MSLKDSSSSLSPAPSSPSPPGLVGFVAEGSTRSSPLEPAVSVASLFPPNVVEEEKQERAPQEQTLSTENPYSPPTVIKPPFPDRSPKPSQTKLPTRRQTTPDGQQETLPNQGLEVPGRCSFIKSPKRKRSHASGRTRHFEEKPKKRRMSNKTPNAAETVAKAAEKVSAPRKWGNLGTFAPRRSRKWQPEFVIQDPKSPLAKADVRAILSHPLAWAALSPEDRLEILAKLPDDTHILNSGTPDAAPNIASLRSDDSFRYDAARFAEHIADGRHDPQWLKEAWKAHERNLAGDFEEFEVKKFEEDWGIELPGQMLPKSLRKKQEHVEKQDQGKQTTDDMIDGDVDRHVIVEQPRATVPKKGRGGAGSPQTVGQATSPLARVTTKQWDSYDGGVSVNAHSPPDMRKG